MIKNLLFDFDGVILDSMKIKGDGFIELFKDYPDNDTKLLEAYHYANGGISRFEKIRYFFETIRKTKVSTQEIEILANEFGKIIATSLFDKSNLISDSVLFIQDNCTQYNCHIVSGAEHQELNALCSHFELTQYFKSIEGSPTVKSKLVANLLKTYNYRAEETLLIGDSINDYVAASENKINFCGYNNPALKSLGNYLETFKNFKS